jgi:tRNA-binding protein
MPGLDSRFAAPGSATRDDVARLDIRVGRVVAAAHADGARQPAHRLWIDFGAAGQRQSSARITTCYPDPAALVGRLVVAIVNLAPIRVAGFRSDVLVLGAVGGDDVRLLSVEAGAEPGQRIA